ncbi:MAG TPA: membrane protein insertase YidC [Candidatus Limnocylindria bacterium]|nr:membrane protein insertase YidC [Candidatus Limnocylindria bacterium]
MDTLYSLLNPLYDAVSWVLLRFHDLWSLIFAPTSGAAWGLSIVGLVVVLRILLFPLFVKQIKAQRGLQQLQPQMKEIQKKYKDDRQKQSEEMMKLYKETGTNPLSSCLPILVQAPFFFALFHVLNEVAKDQTVGFMTQAEVTSMRNATIFGVPLWETFTQGDTLNVKIVAGTMILAMTATTFITQRQLMVRNMPTGMDNPMAQQQKILLYVFPVMFAVFGINFPIGVLIYWLTTNLWTMGQQFWVIRRNPTPGSAAWDDLQKRKAEKAAGRGDTLVVEQPPAPPVVREQPKRQPKSKRKNTPRPKPAEGAGPATPGAPPSVGPADEEAS